MMDSRLIKTKMLISESFRFPFPLSTETSLHQKACLLAFEYGFGLTLKVSNEKNTRAKITVQSVCHDILLVPT